MLTSLCGCYGNTYHAGLEAVREEAEEEELEWRAGWLAAAAAAAAAEAATEHNPVGNRQSGLLVVAEGFARCFASGSLVAPPSPQFGLL